MTQQKTPLLFLVAVFAGIINIIFLVVNIGSFYKDRIVCRGSSYWVVFTAEDARGNDLYVGHRSLTQKECGYPDIDSIKLHLLEEERSKGVSDLFIENIDQIKTVPFKN